MAERVTRDAPLPRVTWSSPLVTLAEFAARVQSTPNSNVVIWIISREQTYKMPGQRIEFGPPTRRIRCCLSLRCCTENTTGSAIAEPVRAVEIRIRLRLLLACLRLNVDARSHLLQLLEPQLGLLTVGPVGIKLDGLLIRLDSARRKHDFVSVAHALGGHHIHQRRAQKIPALRVLGIELGRFFQRLDSLFQLSGIVESDAAIAKRLGGVRRIKLRALVISRHSLFDFPRAPQDSTEIVVISGVGLQRDSLLVGVRRIIRASSRIVCVSEPRPNQI